MLSKSVEKTILVSLSSILILLLAKPECIISANTPAAIVDNGVEGEPEVECGPSTITVSFNTRRPFQGYVYVKGLFEQSGCRNDEHGRQVASIVIPFDSCNLQRSRSLNPKGVTVSTTVVISFHPQFVTEVDRAYRIQCFYMESDKTISSQIDVSEMATISQTQSMPMPVCKYEILENGPNGKPVQFAAIGQQIYHKWSCETETVDTFCATVHSCVVDDGNGDAIQLVNDEGCSLDKILLNNIEYPGDLVAGQTAHVYKYADRAQLFYQCQISVTVKEPHSKCPRPKCTEPTGFHAISLKSLQNEGITHSLSTLEPGNRESIATGIPTLLRRLPPARRTHFSASTSIGIAGLSTTSSSSTTTTLPSDNNLSESANETTSDEMGTTSITYSTISEPDYEKGKSLSSHQQQLFRIFSRRRRGNPPRRQNSLFPLPAELLESVIVVDVSVELSTLDLLDPQNQRYQNFPDQFKQKQGRQRWILGTSAAVTAETVALEGETVCSLRLDPSNGATIIVALIGALILAVASAILAYSFVQLWKLFCSQGKCNRCGSTTFYHK